MIFCYRSMVTSLSWSTSGQSGVVLARWCHPFSRRYQVEMIISTSTRSTSKLWEMLWIKNRSQRLVQYYAIPYYHLVLMWLLIASVAAHFHRLPQGREGEANERSRACDTDCTFSSLLSLLSFIDHRSFSEEYYHWSYCVDVRVALSLTIYCYNGSLTDRRPM